MKFPAFLVALPLSIMLAACWGTPAPADSSSSDSASSVPAELAFSSDALQIETFDEATPFQATSDEPIVFSLNGVDASLIKSTLPTTVIADQLGLCGRTQPDNYYTHLAEQFAPSTQTIYSFFYNQPSADDGLWFLSVMPNIPGYDSLAEFKADFGLCGKPGDLEPQLVSQNWLVLSSPCVPLAGSGTDLVSGCETIRRAVEPTVRVR